PSGSRTVRDQTMPGLLKGIEKYYKEIEFGIQTNGTLLTKEDAAFIKKHNVHVSLSLDAPLPEINDKLRYYQNGTGTFAHVRKTIEMFNDYEWQGVIVTITKNNVNIIDTMAEALYDWGVRSVLFNPISPSVPESTAFVPSIKELIDNYKKFIDVVIKLNTYQPKGRRLVVDNIESLILAIFTSNMRGMYCHMSPCGAGRLSYVITWNGDVYPCSEFIQFEEFKCGNIFEDSIETIINSEACKKLRLRNVNKIDTCNNCPYKLICGANCPAAVYGLSRTLLEKSPYCKFNFEIINYLFEKISEHGIEIAYKLVSESFEEKMKTSKPLVWVER
ncbi:MAG: SPASM domain-containing protein, partial [Caldanaerobacter sp.]